MGVHKSAYDKNGKPIGGSCIKYCPFCGSMNIKKEQDVPRCIDCRAVFFVEFSRFMRKIKK
jgi:transposase-like protein